MLTKRPSNPVHRIAVALALLATGWALTGCKGDENLGAPSPYLPNPGDLVRIGRVAVVELSYDGTYPNLQRDMTQALAKAIRDRGLFHLDTVKRDDPAVQAAAAKLQGAKDFEGLATLRRALGCDALLIGSIHRFEPHPHMQVALHLQLLNLNNGQLIWGLEHTWDVSDRLTEDRIKKFFRETMREDYGPIDWRLATLSPRAFEKYVACEVAGTFDVPDDPP